MKVYLPKYDNDESYEDYYDWLSDNIYYTKEKAEQEILDLGYVKNIEKTRYSNGIVYSVNLDDRGYTEGNARIIELNLI